MQGTTAPTFRATPSVWPAEPHGVPAVTRWVLDDLGDACHVVDVARDVEAVSLPPDFGVIEVMEVPDDDGALLAFMREWGLLVDIGDVVSNRAFHDAAMALRHQAAERHHLTSHPNYVIPMQVARWALGTLRALAAHVVAYRDGDDDGILAAWERHTDHRPEQVSQAWVWWQDAMTQGLHPFRMHVRLSPDDQGTLALPTPTLYNATVLQLTQYLGGDGPMSRCANERCRRPFSVQRTPRRRYANSHHDAGVRYCSHRCAKAQSERDRRARRRQESTDRNER